MIWETILAVVVVLGILIFVHELGHFLVARKVGVKVRTFSLGFGPKIIGRQIGETEYRISAFPLGGYVKLLGEEPGEEFSPEEKTRSFSNQSVGKRMAIVAAGPIFNLLLALVIFVAVFIAGIPVLTPQIGGIVKDSPAERAGLKPLDEIVAVEGRKLSQWEEVKEQIQLSDGRALVLTVKRNGKMFDVRIIPELKESKTILGDEMKEWRIGVSPSGAFTTQHYDPLSAALLGAKKTWDITKLTVIGIVRLIQGRLPSDTIGGPILIAQMAGQQASEGFLNIVLFVAILSINLGVINLLPIPILDGGHLLFFIIEAILGRPISLKKREIAQQIGLFILISLMIFAFYNDIMRIFTKQG